MATQFLTGVFKLRSPTKRKKQILDYVLSEYTIALRDLLLWSKDNLDSIRAEGVHRVISKKTGEVLREQYKERSISAVLPRSSEVQADIASNLKESLVANVSAMLASYLALDEGDKQDAGFPVSRDPSPTAYPNALHELVTLGNDLEAENQARDKLLTIARGQYMPVHISRSRDFAILARPDMSAFYLWMKVLPANHERGQAMRLNGETFVTVSKFGSKFEAGEFFSYRGSTAILLPLELGQRNGEWHWQYHRFFKAALEGEALIKAGKLLKEGDDYFLHVSFGFEVPDEYEPHSYLGIDRGVVYSVSYALVDMDGGIVEAECWPDDFREIRIRAAQRLQERQRKGIRVRKKDYRQQELDNILHGLANRILDKAVENQSMLVFEDLNGLKTVGKFYKSAYQKLYDIVEYKAALRGVPIYARRVKGKSKGGVWAAYSSKICIHCGEDVDRSEDWQIVTCQSCGTVEQADEAAAVNIARRAMYRKADWGGATDKAGDYRAFHRSFANVADMRAKSSLRRDTLETA